MSTKNLTKKELVEIYKQNGIVCKQYLKKNPSWKSCVFKCIYIFYLKYLSNFSRLKFKLNAFKI